MTETLKVIAGRDGYDFTQMNAPYHLDSRLISQLDAAMDMKDVSNMSIGLVNQAFVGCQLEVKDKVGTAVERLNPKKG